MATYIPGNDDYIPQIQPFTPDYNFYSQALDLKQSKYDAARKQLSSLYGSLLSAPMTRADNIESRDRFFKAIEQDIKKMAGVDLSLRQNREAAEATFNQLLDNKYIQKDMVWTKSFMNEMQRAEGFKNCKDIDQCGGGWWEGGEALLMHDRQAFATANPDEAYNMGNAKYVPYQDLNRKALELAKEANINVTTDEITGQWIVTTKNGPQIAGTLQQLFMGSIGKDPKMRSYYNAKARLERLNFMAANEQTYGSKSAAEQVYIQTMMPNIEKMLTGETRALEDRIETTRAKQEIVQEAKSRTSIPENQISMDDLYNRYEQEAGAYQESLDVAEDNQGEFVVGYNNRRYTGAQVDYLLGGMQMGFDIGGAAQVMSMRNAERSIKSNPYSMEAVRHSNRVALEGMKHANRMELEAFKHQNNKALKQMAEDTEAYGNESLNSPQPITNVAGATSVDMTLDAGSYGQKLTGAEEYEEGASQIKRELSANERFITDKVVKQMRNKADETNDVVAKEDFVNLHMAALGAYGRQDKVSMVRYGEYDEYGERNKSFVDGMVRQNVKAVIEKVNQAKDLDTKYRILRNMNFSTDMLNGATVDHIYNENITKLMTPTTENETLRPYLKVIRDNPNYAYANHGIKIKNRALESTQEFFKSQIPKMAAAATKDMGPEWGDAINSYYDENGYVVDKATFVRNMVAKNHDPEMAAGMYGFDYDELTVPDDFDIADLSESDQEALLRYLSIRDDDQKAAAKFMGKYQHLYGKNTERDSDDSVLEYKGIHDVARRMFSEYGEPQGDRAWMDIRGMGNWAAKGLNVPMVDPRAHKNTYTQATISYLKDAMAMPDGMILLNGDFRNAHPQDFEEMKDGIKGNSELRAVVQTLYNDMINDKKSKNRPMPNITYTHIALNDDDMVGLNIKLNDEYRKRYKGTKDQEGIMADPILSTEGFTIYLPKDKAQNQFTQRVNETPISHALMYNGSIELDNYAKHTENLRMVADKNTGIYRMEGKVRIFNDDGTSSLQSLNLTAPNTAPVDQLYADWNNAIRELVHQAEVLDQKFAKQ